MTPVQPEELSALIDGELDPQRALAVEAQIAADPVLKREFDELCGLDDRWRDAAWTSNFPVQVLPVAPAAWRSYLAMGAVVIVLLGVRAAARLIDPWPVALTLQCVALISILVWLTRAARQRDSVSQIVTE